jgi:sec-independent protein translocase protein TatA
MIGTGELIVILCVVLVLFGGKKLPELARSLGIGIREFKKACNGDYDANATAASKKSPESVILEVEAEHEDTHQR